MQMSVEPWHDEHGVVWELGQLGLDSALDAADGDAREGSEVIARFGDPEDGRDFLRREGFEPMRGPLKVL